MKILIIQASPPHTASTLLVNAIYGLIEDIHLKNIIFQKNINVDIVEHEFNNIIVIKTHNLTMDLIKQYKKYKLVFVCSQRKDLGILIPQKYHKYSIIFNFEELDDKNNSVEKIVNTIYEKLKVLPIELNKITCMERIVKMNKRYEEIKNNPFSFVDPFFHIHGSHRNRLPSTPVLNQEPKTILHNLSPIV